MTCHRKSILAVFSFLILGSPLPSQAKPSAPTTIAPPETSKATPVPAPATEEVWRLTRERDIAHIRTELIANQTNWFAILVSAVMGGFSLLIAAVVIFFTFRFSKAAVTEAKQGIAEERTRIQKLLEEANAAVASIRSHEQTAKEITENLKPGEAPASEVERKALRDIAREAQAKPRRERTLDDYRALVTVAAMSEEWDVVERRAGAMAYLFDDAADEDLFFPLFYRAVALNKLGRDAEANIIYDEIDEKFGRSDQPASQEQVAMALLNKGVTLRSMDRPNDAIAAYDDLLARFGNSNQPALQKQVAMALVNKGIALGAMDRPEDEIATYDNLLARFGDSNELALQERVAKALINKGIALSATDRHLDAIAAFDDLLARFGDSNQPSLQERVAKALINKGIALSATDRHDDAIAAFDDLLARFGDSDQPALQEQVAKAQVNKGVTLGAVDRHDDAIAAFDDLLARFGDSDQPAFREMIAMALANKSITLGAMDRHDDAIAAYDDLLARFGDSDQPAFQEMVATALFNKACISALRRDSATCIAYLTQWRDRKGKLDCDAIANDSDFDPIRADPDFIAFLRASGCEPTTAPSPAASPVDSKPAPR
ncbi:tetratricopeptide repeat protein [Sphingopyxis witflariensis]|uniref:tetratricopeptide repeat protein n=1 Tax=Sphingopyxis witflariensis TaxID=173675 RepID=UPI001181BB09|nr:tetratricopeptide repeat protein [Sphingopyxis witflariensis]